MINSQYASSPEHQTSPAAACKLCGRQDETVRYAVFPYTFSVLVLTFRRTFAGLWCRQHQNIYHLLAAAITAVVGWFGIPFGFLYTPIILFKLARDRGHEASLDTENGMLQYRIAQEKLARGDTDGWRKSLEASIGYHAIPLAKEQYQRAAGQLSNRIDGQADTNVFTLSVILTGFLALAACLGLAASLADIYLASWLESIFSASDSIFMVIASWAPTVATGVIAFTLLGQVFAFLIEKLRLSNRLLAILLALLSGGLFIHLFAGGRLIYYLVSDFLNGTSFLSIPGWVTTLAAILAQGSLLQFQEWATNMGAVGIIYLILTAFLAVLCFCTLLAAALGQTARQRKLSEVLQAEQTGSHAVPVLVSVGVTAVALAGLLVIAPQKSRVDYIEALWRYYDANEAYNQGDSEAYIQHLETALDLQPNHPIIGQELVFAYMNGGDLAAALDTVDQMIAENQDITTARALKALILYTSGDLAGAEQEVGRSLEIEPQHELALIVQGSVFNDQGKYDEARTVFEQMIAQNPQSGEGYLGLGAALEMLMDLEGSKAAYQQALEIYPDWAVAHLGLGRVYLQTFQLDAAKVEFDTALSLDLENYEANFWQAMVYTFMGKFDDAMLSIEHLEDLEIDVELHHPLLAYLYHLQGNAEQARAESKLADQIANRQPEVLMFTGDFKMRLHQFQAARRDYEGYNRYLATPEGYLRLGEALCELGQFDKAEENYDLAAQAGAAAEGLSSLFGDILLYQGKYDQAVDELKSGLAEKPDSYLLHAQLSEAYLLTGQAELALSEAQAAVQVNEYSAYAQANLGLAHLALGEISLARQAAERSLKLDPLGNIPNYILGMCNLAQDNPAGAKAELEAFLSKDWGRPTTQGYRAEAEAVLSGLK